MVISFDRYLAVCFPVHRRPTVRRAVIIVMFTYLLVFIIITPTIVVVHYDDFIKDCMYRSDINWFTQWDKYFGQGYVMTCVFTSFLLYCRVIFVLRRLSKVHARLVTNITSRIAPPSTSMAVSQIEYIKGPKTATSSSICNEGGQTAGPKTLNEDGVGQTKNQTDQSVVHTALGSMHSESLDESQANGLPVLTNHGSPQTGNVEVVSGKHRKTTALPDATDAAPVIVVASSQTETKYDQNANIRLSEKKLTLMLGTITGIYLISMIPLLIGRYIPIETRRAFMNRSDVHHTIYAIVFRLYEINSIINVFVYWQLNRGFRQDCKEMFRQVKRAIFKK
ncbi:uncharacterized protein LOC105443544 [Strongylocentrotus purpuratus]|uniref:G-protein coupled receptors family 1 profile domain-containing protein n=1 Tax=Strongylocentrotus purpuratus TaxID=7668 RepID=A0A7M7HK05_STRPU|nr:uncharacterized protein LOC105443544 [Strongylocentrotus purpuratus]|eukprot:XP_011661390.1 PREDICTED: uncharacterized protein LOC105436975 [Strongylocentrotus purpuratus]